MAPKNLNEATELVIPEDFSVEPVAEFRKAVNKLIEEGNINFVFNFHKCSFIDSTGLGVIIALYKKCKELGGNIRLKAINPQVKKVFILTRLDKVFEIVD